MSVSLKSARVEAIAGKKPHSSNYLTSGRFETHSKQGTEYFQAYRAWDKATSTVRRFTKDQYVAKAKDDAQKHYTDSIIKIAGRITKKGISANKLTVDSSWLDRNLNATISDGNKTVRAFTILAYGPVQRPHYRFLIK